MCGLQCNVQLSLAMSYRNKTSLKSRGSQVNAIVEHSVEELAKPFGITGHYLVKSFDFCLVRKEQPKHATPVTL